MATIVEPGRPAPAVISEARLFGPGSPATGEPAQIMLDAHELQVRTAGATHIAAIDALRLREVGTGRSGLELAWDAADGLRSVQVFDVEALRRLRTHAALGATAQMTALRAGQRRAVVGRILGWSAIGVFVLLPALALLGFLWQADRIAAAAAEHVSIEQETKLGEQAFAALRPSLKLQESGAGLETVQTLGARLTRGSAYTYRFYVADDEAINAFALPGGVIVVHTGLIAATRRPEELAGVLAHEIQHVEQRHSLRAAVKDLGLRGLWMLLTGKAGGGLPGRIALQLTTLQFSRTAEMQADARGVETLAAKGIDPSGMADFFALLAQQDEAAPPAFLSTHPASAEREQLLRSRIRDLSARRFQPLEPSQWPPAD